MLLKDPKNIEEENFNPSIRSVLGEGAHQPLSTGKVLTQIGEFEIVNEGAPDATGDIKAATPQFSECHHSTGEGRARGRVNNSKRAMQGA